MSRRRREVGRAHVFVGKAEPGEPGKPPKPIKRYTLLVYRTWFEDEPDRVEERYVVYLPKQRDQVPEPFQLLPSEDERTSLGGALDFIGRTFSSKRKRRKQ